MPDSNNPRRSTGGVVICVLKLRIYVLIIGVISGCTTTQPARVNQSKNCPVTIERAEFSNGWDHSGNDVARCDIRYSSDRGVVAVEFMISPISSFRDELPGFIHRDYGLTGRTTAHSKPMPIGSFGPFGFGSVEVVRVRLRDGSIWTRDSLAVITAIP